MASASELDKAVDKLIKRERGWQQFKPTQAVGERPGALSTGRPYATASSGGGGAFAESDYAAREYWPERELARTTDGLFVFLGRPIKSIALEGGDKATFKEPV
jgi:hypothetical protein